MNNLDEEQLNRLTNEELWQLFPIVLSPWQPFWQQRYADESENLCAAVGVKWVSRISHIGSTSVPGLIAKPTIDILLEMQPDCDLKQVKSGMDSLGYICQRQPKNPPPHLLGLKGYTLSGFADEVFHLHVRYPGDWDELYFCWYLRLHPGAAAEYAALKRSLKDQFERDRDAYTNAKGDFIRSVTALAREAANGRFAPV